MTSFLIGDVGGTKTILELARCVKNGKDKEIILRQMYPSQEYKGLVEMVKEFLKNIDVQDYPVKACIAICGFVIDNKVGTMDNLNWKDMSGEGLAKSLKIKEFTLINDLYALAKSQSYFRQEDLIQLNSKANLNQTGDKLLINYGTGIGVSRIINYEDYNGQARIDVLPSEASFISASVKNDFDLLYNLFIRRRLALSENQPTQYQHLIDSSNLINMYQFFVLLQAQHKEFNFDQKDSTQITVEQVKDDKQIDPSLTLKNIVKRAVEGDKAAEHAIKYFLEILGNSIYAFCLAYLPVGGVTLFSSFLKEINLKYNLTSGVYNNILIRNFLLDTFMRDRFSTAIIYLRNGEENLTVFGAFEVLKEKGIN